MSTIVPKHAKRSMRLTHRDVCILETIYTFGGMMSLRQIDTIFFSGKGRSQPRQRMYTLKTHGFVKSPDRDHRHLVPHGESVFWLARKGAEVVSAQSSNANAKTDWRRKPRYTWIAHDLAANDFRISMQQAAKMTPHLTLEKWMPERYFWQEKTSVSYRDARNRARKRRMIPDGFFAVRDIKSQKVFGFSFEVDMGTEDNPRFVREKVYPGIAYLTSKAYRQQTGMAFGRWLVVTTSERRVLNMKRHTERVDRKGLYYFTTLSRVAATNPITDAIWWQSGKTPLTTIIPSQVLEQ